MRPAARRLGWTAVAALLLGVVLGSRSGAPRSTSTAGRLLGPIAGVAASIQWVRVHAAVRAGRSDLVFARAEHALRLDPGAAEGWAYLAWHLAFDRGSAAREPDARRRLRWIRAGLATAARGEERTAQPEELAYLQGLILAYGAAGHDDLPWPGGPQALWLEAARHFQRADRLGHPDAALSAVEALGELERPRTER